MSKNTVIPDNSTENGLYSSKSVANRQVDILEILYKNVSILPLPTSLVNYRNKNLLVSAITLAAGLLFTATLRTWSACIICTLASVYLAFKAISVEHDYNSGNIIEITAVCMGIQPSFYRDWLTATFASKTDEGESSYFKFIVPDKRLQDDFIVGAPYVLYYDRDAKNLLLGYVQVGLRG